MLRSIAWGLGAAAYRRSHPYRQVMTSSLEEARARIVESVKIDVLSDRPDVDNASKLKEVARNFYSDTVTVPTPEMGAYGLLASLGDDVYAYEPSTRALEQHTALIAGKQAGLFLPSGTMANQIALRVHLTQPPYSVLCDRRSHINSYETGGTAFHSGASTIAVMPRNGHHITLRDVREHIILGDDIHIAPTEVIALENTLSGTILPQDEAIAIGQFARSQGVKMHLDGARIWHVAVEMATPLRELCEPFDSVSLCFSKGLGAPIGTVLVGSSQFISKARRFRKLFGGGMRQTGYLAACAAYALTHNFSRLSKVHALARRLEARLEQIGARITTRAETCMVFYDPAPLGLTYSEINEAARQLKEPISLGDSRLVLHIQTSEEVVEDFIKLLETLKNAKASDLASGQ